MNLRNPALCEELRVRDILDNAAVMTSGSLVAAYELSGLHSQYHSDETQNRAKEAFEAVVRGLPERSMRLHLRFEIRQNTGNVIRRYVSGTQNPSAVLAAIDEERCRVWSEKESAGEFFDYRLHAMFHWDPIVHHAEAGREWEHKLSRTWNLSANRCIQRGRSEHDRLMAEFTSLLAGIETTLAATGVQVDRLHDEDLFLLIKQSLNPLSADTIPLRNSANHVYESARSQLTNMSIEGESPDHLRAGGLLYAFISLKDPPDGTYPGILRELLSLEFPVIVNTEIVIPDQARVISQYKWRQRKMMAAQRDINGAFRVNEIG